VARILALAPDLFFAAKIEETLTAAGHQVTLASREDELEAAAGPDLVIVDLDASGPTAPDVGEGAPLLGFYSHVEVDTRRSAEAAGYDLVVPRSRMSREMPELVARLVGSRG
jgi:hypothetical protein